MKVRKIKRPAPTPAKATRVAQVDKIKRELAVQKRQPNQEALKLAANVGSRREANCAFRSSLARRKDSDAGLTVLAQLVGRQAGRAAEPRIKLVLTLLFLAREEDRWTVENVPAATWALLFGLDNVETLGAARVTGAIRSLDAAGIIEADQKRGREPRLRVRHETGEGHGWTSPVGEKGKTQAAEDVYAQLDAGFWANGWITVLSARAIAALLILLDRTWGRRGTDSVRREVREGLTVDYVQALVWYHLTEEQLTSEHAISRDLFDRGVKELVAWGLVEERKRGKVERTTWGERRWYRELRVRLEVLRTPVADVWNGRRVAQVGPSSEMDGSLIDLLLELDATWSAPSTKETRQPALGGQSKTAGPATKRTLKQAGPAT